MALEGYSLAAIESGGVKDAIEATVGLTDGVRELLTWYDDAAARRLRGPQGLMERRRLADALCEAVDAHAELVKEEPLGRLGRSPR